MDNSKTPKIVVGIGLAAVYSGLAFYFLRDTPSGNIAPSAMTAPPIEIAAAPVPPPTVAPSSTDISPSVTEQSAAVTEAPAPAVSPAATSPTAAAAQAARVEANRQGRDQAIVREQFRSTTPPAVAPETAAVAPSPTTEIAEAGGQPASPAADVPQSAQAPAAVVNDSQITAEVKEQIAAVAPASTIDVTTTDGVVELSGSVPSQEEITKVSVAARSVENVKAVDISALMVSN